MQTLFSAIGRNSLNEAKFRRTLKLNCHKPRQPAPRQERDKINANDNCERAHTHEVHSRIKGISSFARSRRYQYVHNNNINDVSAVGLYECICFLTFARLNSLIHQIIFFKHVSLLPARTTFN